MELIETHMRYLLDENERMMKRCSGLMDMIIDLKRVVKYLSYTLIGTLCVTLIMLLRIIGII